MSSATAVIAGAAVVAAGLPAVLAPSAAYAAGASPIVISQLRAQGAGGDFLELQNISGAPVTLAAADGWTLTLTKNDGSPLCSAVGPGGGAFDLVLSAGQHYLFAGASYTAGPGIHAADSTFVAHTGTGTACSSALADSAGGAVLTDAAKSAGDTVTYGTATAGAEGVTTLDPSNGDSIRRKQNGTQDTDSNAADFALQSPANPLGSTATDPTITTVDATSIGTTSATINGTVDTHGQSVTCAFDWGTDATYTSSTTYDHVNVGCDAGIPGGAGPQPFSLALTGLTPNTTYHFRPHLGALGGIYYGADKPFTTHPLTPTATTMPAIVTGATTATLNGTVNVYGGTGATCAFSWGLTSSYGSSTPCSPTPSGTGDQSVSADLTGLTPGAIYHYKVVVTTAGGTASPSELSFTQYPAPTGDIAPATDPVPTGATVHGTVNPHGAPVSDCHFEYGITTSYGISKPCETTPSGTTESAVSAVIRSVDPETTIYYRLVVTTAGGTLTTRGTSFTSSNLAPSVVTGANPTVYITGAILTGTVDVKGQAVSGCHFEYGPTSAYGTTAPCATKPTSYGGVSTVTQSIAGLKPSTSYHYRLVATTTTGTGVGNDVTFTTKGQQVEVVLPPDTTLLPPVVHQAKRTVTFTFKARNVVGTAKLQCALVKLPTKKGVAAPAPKYSTCTSPRTTKPLAKGRYRFYVRAVGANGTDPTPASRTFAI